MTCPAGKTSTGSHDASGKDTTCDATYCDTNEKVVNHVCTACPAGKTSTGKHDASGKDTTCDATSCGTNEKVVAHVCTACPTGKISMGQHDASGPDTTCGAISCGPNKKVVKHKCTTCPAGKTSTGSHDASGKDTTCDATSCGANENVVGHVCTACPAGKTSEGSHDASGIDTTCKVTFALTIRKGKKWACKATRASSHKAYCRCATADNKKAISICNSGCGGPNKVCWKGVGCASNERRCNKNKCTCKPSGSPGNTMTYSMCEYQCKEAGMLVVAGAAGVAAGTNTGCNIN